MSDFKRYLEVASILKENFSGGHSREAADIIEELCSRIDQAEWSGWKRREVYFDSGVPCGHREIVWNLLSEKKLWEIYDGLSHAPSTHTSYYIILARAIEKACKEANQ